MLKHFNITISGKVQRVGFRFMSMQTAYELGIKGFVKNIEHNKVYIEIEGEEEPIKKFLKWAKKGPFGSEVKEFNAEEGEMRNFTAFDIVH